MNLPERIVSELQRIRSELDAKGELLSAAQLNSYYQTFRERFGPAVLTSQDGETLLMTMHGRGNKDSLVYWLEFKNDEEFPSLRFGGIGGGSALAFGIYRRQETGVWMTGSPLHPKELSLEEAVEVARKHRPQLLAGLELLGRFPATSTCPVLACRTNSSFEP